MIPLSFGIYDIFNFPNPWNLINPRNTAVFHFSFLNHSLSPSAISNANSFISLHIFLVRFVFKG